MGHFLTCCNSQRTVLLHFSPGSLILNYTTRVRRSEGDDAETTRGNLLDALQSNVGGAFREINLDDVNQTRTVYGNYLHLMTSPLVYFCKLVVEKESIHRRSIILFWRSCQPERKGHQPII